MTTKGIQTLEWHLFFWVECFVRFGSHEKYAVFSDRLTLKPIAVVRFQIFDFMKFINRNNGRSVCVCIRYIMSLMYAIISTNHGFFCLLNSGNQHRMKKWPTTIINDSNIKQIHIYWPLSLRFFAPFPSFIWLKSNVVIVAVIYYKYMRFFYDVLMYVNENAL